MLIFGKNGIAHQPEIARAREHGQVFHASILTRSTHNIESIYTMGNTVKRKILLQMADPSGNKTAFVLSGARPEDYKSIAKYIMEQTEYGAEQVAFVKSTHAFDMSCMEFCGNAARAFAFLSAKGMIDGKPSEDTRTFLEVTVSDSQHPVICGVDTESGHASCSIPLPKRVRTLKHCDFAPAIGKSVIVMDGIIHLIADDIEYDPQSFSQIRDAMIEQFDPPALGVMYLNTKTHDLKPVVYLPDIDSTCIEGSCGSGSAGAAYYLATHEAAEKTDTGTADTNIAAPEDSQSDYRPADTAADTSNTAPEDSQSDSRPADGTYDYELKQPAGTIHASCVITNGEPSALYIEGPVALSDPEFINIEYESAEDEISAMSNTW